MGFWSDKVAEIRGPVAQPVPRAQAWWQQGMPQAQPQTVPAPAPQQVQAHIEPGDGSEKCPRCGLGFYGDFFAENMGGAGGYSGGHKRCFSCGYGNRIDQSGDVIHGASAQAIRQAKVKNIRTNQKLNHGSGFGIGAYQGGRYDSIPGGQLPLIA